MKNKSSFIIELNNKLDIVNEEDVESFFDSFASGINFLEYLDDFDSKIFNEFIKNLSEDSINKAIILIIRLLDENKKAVLRYCGKKNDNYIFDLYCDDFDKVSPSYKVLEREMYRLILSQFDYDFFIYNTLTKNIEYKSTKNFINEFEGDIDNFIKFLINKYQINDSSLSTLQSLELLKNDLLSGTADKKYSLLLNNSKYVVIDSRVVENKEGRVIIAGVDSSYSTLNNSFYLESFDGLTGLYNRQTIIDMAKNKIEALKTNVTLIVLDIDNFKECNDTFGHQYGDMVLVTTSKAIKEAIKGFGSAGRLGGDEFLIILDSTNEEIIRNIARNIRIGVQWSIPADKLEAVVTCSMGISRFPSDGVTYNELFDIADRALYIAKSKGRNCYIIYRPEIHKEYIINKKVGLKSRLDYNDDYNLIKDSLNLLEENKIEEVLNNVMKFLNVDRVSVYKYSKRLYSLGKNIELDERIDHIFKDEYNYHLNEYGYMIADNTNYLDALDRKRYDIYLAEQIGSTLEVSYKDEKNELGYICYDVFKPAKTFDRRHITFIIFLSRILLEKL